MKEKAKDKLKIKLFQKFEALYNDYLDEVLGLDEAPKLKLTVQVGDVVKIESWKKLHKEFEDVPYSGLFLMVMKYLCGSKFTVKKINNGNEIKDIDGWTITTDMVNDYFLLRKDYVLLRKDYKQLAWEYDSTILAKDKLIKELLEKLAKK